jgi:hypothetical protein
MHGQKNTKFCDANEEQFSLAHTASFTQISYIISKTLKSVDASFLRKTEHKWTSVQHH